MGLKIRPYETTKRAKNLWRHCGPTVNKYNRYPRGMNIYRLRARAWYQQGKKVLNKTPAEDVLRNLGHNVYDLQEYLYPRLPKANVPVVGILGGRPVPIDQNHPDWKQTPCYIFKDDDLLVEGMKQAQVLTNTIEIKELPPYINELENKLSLSDDFHNEVIRKIKLATMFEATQLKLPKAWYPDRPGVKMPARSGIVDFKKNEILCKNLMHLCERYFDTRERSLLTNSVISLPFPNIFNKTIQFNLTADLSLTSQKPLPKIMSPEETKDVQLPELGCVDCTASLKRYHFYDLEDIFPVPATSKWPYIHTSLIHFNETQTKNLFDVVLTTDQFNSRSLLKAFSIAAAQARQKYGDDVLELPEPIVTQVVHTNARKFHFGIYQLNTLSLDRQSEVKNVFWHEKPMHMYYSSTFIKGKPTLHEYEKGVIAKLIAFCQNR